MSLPWKKLETISDLKQALDLSFEMPVLLFKHSTRCSISDMALGRLERNWKDEELIMAPFYLDLLQHRDISNEIATSLQVTHQSPQAILVRNGQAIYQASHSEISLSLLKEQIQ
jgi:bacillithiol system protein YtxJ